MNTREYADYESSVAAFFVKEGVNCLTREPNDEESGPEFKASPCDVCGSRYAGNRVNMGGFNPATNQIQDGYSVCTDCEWYVEYGHLDDMTMMDMEAE